jgi:hypothetical protein
MKLAHLKSVLLGPCVIALSACAAFASAPPSQLTLHQQDFGRQYSIHVGDTVKVDLLDTFPVPGSSVVWSAASTDPSVMTRISETRETPATIARSQAHYIAIFKAEKSGAATIKLSGAARCEAMNPAACPQQSGTMTVTVS